MNRWRAFLEAIHLTAAGICTGALLMTGVTAAILFPAVKKLDPELPGFAAYDGEHWRIVGGHIGDPMFFSVDVVQFVALLLTFGTLTAIAFSRHESTRRLSFAVRSLALLVAFVTFCWRFFIVTPPMNVALKAYWKAAAAGDNDAAAAHQGVFDAGHGSSSTLMQITLVAMLVATFAGIWNAVAASSQGGAAGRHARGDALSDRLEEPQLARGR